MVGHRQKASTNHIISHYIELTCNMENDPIIDLLAETGKNNLIKKHLVLILYIINIYFYTGGYFYVQQTQNKNIILKSRYKKKIWSPCLSLCLVLGR